MLEQSKVWVLKELTWNLCSNLKNAKQIIAIWLWIHSNIFVKDVHEHYKPAEQHYCTDVTDAVNLWTCQKQMNNILSKDISIIGDLMKVVQSAV